MPVRAPESEPPAPHASDAPPAAGPSRTQRARSLIVPIVFAAAGIGLVVFMVHHVGLATLLALMRAAAPLLPVAIALEAGRIACEVLAARALYRGILDGSPAQATRRMPPWSALLRVHLMTYGVVAFAPAGRATGEAVRAAMLARYLGGPSAAAAGTVSQALVLVATGLFSLPCALAAHLAGAPALVGSLLLQAVVLCALGALVLLAARRREVGKLLRRFRKVEQAGDAYVAAMHALPVLPLRALALSIGSRAMQVLVLATVLFAVGAHVDLRSALVAMGAMLVGTSAGDFVPGQLGATDGALALFHTAIGATPARAIGAALLVHVVQLTWTLISVLVPLVWRAPVTDAHPDDAGPTLDARSVTT
jgi:uncharacterized membrane protein YbhN (UPF0104 family)